MLLRSQSAPSESTGITPGRSTAPLLKTGLWQKISGRIIANVIDVVIRRNPK